MTIAELVEAATPDDRGVLRFAPPYRQMSVSVDEANFLYALVRALKPRNVLELGTGLGLSGRFIAEALADNDEGGYLRTFEPNRGLAEMARVLLGNLGEGNTDVEVGDGYEVSAKDVDFVYIDSASTLRHRDIRSWLAQRNWPAPTGPHTYRGLVLVHDSERDYPEIAEHGNGVYLPTANGMWLGRAK